MKETRKPSDRQLNLSLLNAATAVHGKQRELNLALVELLVSAAGTAVDPEPNGGQDESETHV
jgi:hypothetical protein